MWPASAHQPHLLRHPPVALVADAIDLCGYTNPRNFEWSEQPAVDNVWSMQLAAASFALHTPCPRCRKQVLPQAAFCPRCGVRLHAAQYSAPSAPRVVVTPFRPQIPVIGSPTTLEYAIPHRREKPKRVTTSKPAKGRWVAIVGVIMGARFFAALVNQDSSTSSPVITPMPRFAPPAPIAVPHLSPPVVYIPTVPAPTIPRADGRNRDSHRRFVDDPRFTPVPNQPGVYRYSPAR